MLKDLIESFTFCPKGEQPNTRFPMSGFKFLTDLTTKAVQCKIAKDCFRVTLDQCQAGKFAKLYINEFLCILIRYQKLFRSLFLIVIS